ncbi:MAG TPA: hypothetical protein ENI55_04605 [Alphaproteobacteria bacterium]|nr:hypothetical protein [Alphaproteobacteria bacterium]
MQAFVAVLVFLALLVGPAAAGQDRTDPFKSWCPNKDIPYCSNVGKKAFNSCDGVLARTVCLRVNKGLLIGPIIGVIWRNYGDPLKLNPSQIYHFAKDSAWYYIIGPGADLGPGVPGPFLRRVDSIRPQ